MTDKVYLVFLVGLGNTGSIFISAFKTRELAQEFIDKNADGISLIIMEKTILDSV